MTKPITDPHQDTYQVVVSFRLDPNTSSIDQIAIAEHFRRLMVPVLIKPAWIVAGLDVAVRRIGAGGEASIDEGRWDRS